MKYLLLFVLAFSSIIFSSCEPSCSEYIIANKTEQNVKIIFYHASFLDTVSASKNQRTRAELLCSPQGINSWYLVGYDSIHLFFDDERFIKYTNSQPSNNIYDTENRDVWIEEYSKKRKYGGGDYRYVFTIDESLIGE